MMSMSPDIIKLITSVVSVTPILTTDNDPIFVIENTFVIGLADNVQSVASYLMGDFAKFQIGYYQVFKFFNCLYRITDHQVEKESKLIDKYTAFIETGKLKG